MTHPENMKNTPARLPRITRQRNLSNRSRGFTGERFFSRTQRKASRIFRTNPVATSGHTRNSRILPSTLTLQIQLYPRRFVIAPKERREEFVATLDDLSKRLINIINSNRTKTTVRLRAMQVLNELIKTSYTMVRDAEVEDLERETEKLEEEEGHTQTEEIARKEPADSA